MSPRSARTLLASSALALAAGWLAWGWIQDRRSSLLEVHAAAREVIDPIVKRPPETAGFELKLDPVDPREWRYFLNERQAARYFSILHDESQVYDPWVYCRDKGNLTIEMPWQEHPDGKFLWKSNSLGCREDHELSNPLPDLRVLVAGDSHTCGVCNDAESYANLLEGQLAKASPDKSVEVLNAGLGGYTFYNYLGTILRLGEFKPRVIVVGVFGGNDFHELLPLYLRFNGIPWVPLTKDQDERRAKALEACGDAMGQGFATVDAFRNVPGEEAIVARGALELCAEIQRSAKVRGARLIVVYIPSPFEVSRYDSDERVARVRKILELDEADAQIWTRFGDGLLNGLSEQGIEHIDMRPIFAAEASPPYWKGDFHLDLRGHELVARALEPLVKKALADPEAER
jgi:lysophospholipase L1-like esterase